jgi:hypothetical protein
MAKKDSYGYAYDFSGYGYYGFGNIAFRLLEPQKRRDRMKQLGCFGSKPRG